MEVRTSEGVGIQAAVLCRRCVFVFARCASGSMPNSNMAQNKANMPDEHCQLNTDGLHMLAVTGEQACSESGSRKNNEPTANMPAQL